jgi:hypothetical protein
MYQSYISDESILFVRHYGTYEGAEGFTAVLSTLKSYPNVTQLKAVCSDFSAVTAVTLHDTDRAYGTYLIGELTSYGQDVNSVFFVRVINPDNVAVNEMIAERNRRLTSHLIDLEAICQVYNLPDALKELGLPVDYCIEYPAEK